jgi:hypothetical protein
MFYRPVFCSRGLTKKAARKTWLAGTRPGHDGGIILELSGLPAMQGIATGAIVRSPACLGLFSGRHFGISRRRAEQRLLQLADAFRKPRPFAGE